MRGQRSLIEDVREEVREIDEQIIKLVVMRRKLAEKILEAKKVDKIKINDEEQKKTVLRRVEKTARANNLDENAIKEIFKILIEMNTKRQYELLGKTKN
ncbi:MAG: chorismate mutase [Candidatus Methanolliviera hydrocarbonicum]|uniref:Chorismate mutase n=1 Tax=Candidatus Methanolliviera hydrocarbonicum TaxID=2491085 RepID=A0A520KX91_9EURY|nr:MAG: chorismate mutase [Candidatus Methanolliviera hydrocarbonicum]